MTVTTKLQLFSFPEASWKTYVTVVSPTRKKESGGFDRLISRSVPDKSEAVGSSQLTVLPASPSSIVTIWSGGQFEMAGGVVSTEE